MRIAGRAAALCGGLGAWALIVLLCKAVGDLRDQAESYLREHRLELLKLKRDIGEVGDALDATIARSIAYERVELDELLSERPGAQALHKDVLARRRDRLEQKRAIEFASAQEAIGLVAGDAKWEVREPNDEEDGYWHVVVDLDGEEVRAEAIRVGGLAEALQESIERSVTERSVKR